MEVVVEDFFYRQLAFCPAEFQEKFRKIYQQLKIVDDPLEIKAISQISKGFYKVTIQKSRISLKTTGHKAIIGLFLFNEYYTENE